MFIQINVWILHCTVTSQVFLLVLVKSYRFDLTDLCLEDMSWHILSRSRENISGQQTVKPFLLNTSYSYHSTEFVNRNLWRRRILILDHSRMFKKGISGHDLQKTVLMISVSSEVYFEFSVCSRACSFFSFIRRSPVGNAVSITPACFAFFNICLFMAGALAKAAALLGVYDLSA